MIILKRNGGIKYEYFPKTLAKAFTEETDESQRASPYQTLGKIIDISIGEIRPNPVQPRRYFSPAELTSLAKAFLRTGSYNLSQ